MVLSAISQKTLITLRFTKNRKSAAYFPHLVYKQLIPMVISVKPTAIAAKRAVLWRLGVSLALVLGICLPIWSASAYQSYRIYAEQLTAQLPQDVKIRPDLEAVLDRLANAARLAKGLKSLKPSGQFKIAARAQAIDMVLGNFVGHSSRQGFLFPSRFDAFANKAAEYPSRAENAARERSGGAPDSAKVTRLFEQWMNSGGHRRNLLNPSYTGLSSGVVQTGDSLYAIQIFWSQRPCGSSALSINTSCQ